MSPGNKAQTRSTVETGGVSVQEVLVSVCVCIKPKRSYTKTPRKSTILSPVNPSEKCGLSESDLRQCTEYAYCSSGNQLRTGIKRLRGLRSWSGGHCEAEGQEGKASQGRRLQASHGLARVDLSCELPSSSGQFLSTLKKRPLPLAHDLFQTIRHLQTLSIR